MPMKQEGSRSNSATSNRPSKWSNATHNNNRGRRRGSSRRARIRRRSRRRKSLNSPLAAGGWSTLWHLVFQRVRSLTLKRRQVGRAGRGDERGEEVAGK